VGVELTTKDRLGVDQLSLVRNADGTRCRQGADVNGQFELRDPFCELDVEGRRRAGTEGGVHRRRVETSPPGGDSPAAQFSVTTDCPW
jgi:hypothetical protein